MTRGESRHFPPLRDIGGRLTPYVYVGPTLVLVLVFLIYPLANVLIFSGLDWNGFGRKVFVGLGNFAALFRDPLFWVAFRANGISVIFFSLIPTLLGVLLSSVIGRVDVPAEKFFRAVLLAPQVIASVAMGIIFDWIFAPTFGVLNGLLALLGLSRLQLPWLGNQSVAPFSIGLVGTWLWLGFAVILFYSGIKKIEETLYDSAKIDGASPFRQLVSITVPLLRAEIVVVIIMTLVWSFGSSVFGIVVSITNGGYKTTPVSLYAYQLAFVQGRMGYGSAVVVVLMVLILGLSVLTYRLGEGRKW